MSAAALNRLRPGPSRPCVTVPLVGQITIRGIGVDLPASARRASELHRCLYREQAAEFGVCRLAAGRYPEMTENLIWVPTSRRWSARCRPPVSTVCHAYLLIL